MHRRALVSTVVPPATTWAVTEVGISYSGNSDELFAILNLNTPEIISEGGYFTDVVTVSLHTDRTVYDYTGITGLGLTAGEGPTNYAKYMLCNRVCACKRYNS